MKVDLEKRNVNNDDKEVEKEIKIGKEGEVVVKGIVKKEIIWIFMLSEIEKSEEEEKKLEIRKNEREREKRIKMIM